MSHFIQDCINGNALIAEIDDYIEQWHNSGSDLPLHDFLGMSQEEYALFIQSESYIPSIVAAHNGNVRFKYQFMTAEK